jgi:ABC-type branched-subunit amino acid transport system substrate-binding protein
LDIKPLQWNWLSEKTLQVFPFIENWRNDNFDNFSFGFGSRYGIDLAGYKTARLADFRPGLTAIRSADPEAVLIVMTERDGSTFMRQYREVGIEAQVFSRGSLTSPLFLEFTEDDPTIGEGILEFSFWAFGIDPDHDEAFFERFDTPNSPHRAMSYYSVRYVIAEAIRNAIINNDGELTREAIRDELAAIDIETPIGPIAFDDHNQAYPFGTIQTILDGETTFLDTVELVPVERDME